jgi:pimeloyl-ACP methyl ester carboxylesterase
MAAAAERLTKGYGSLHVPAVIIAGTEDLNANARTHSFRLHVDLDGSELRLVDGIRHMLHRLVPDAVLAILTAERLAPGTALA